MKISENLKEAKTDKSAVKAPKKSATKKPSARKSAAKKVAVKRVAIANATKKTAVAKKTASGQKTGDVKTALLKKAMGYDAAEITEEYSVDENGEVSLSKRKVIKKNVPPDVAAIKFILECEEGEEKPLEEMTDEELIAEKERLLSELAKEG